MRSSAIFAAGLILGLTLAIGFGAFAQTYVVFSGLAQHLDRSSHCNNHLTPGVGLEGKGYAVGFYDNSNCKTSFYAAKFWTPLNSQIGSVHTHYGILSGVVSGYEKPILPVAGLVASFEKKEYGVNLILIPPADGSTGVLWLQFKLAWN